MKSYGLTTFDVSHLSAASQASYLNVREQAIKFDGQLTAFCETVSQIAEKLDASESLPAEAQFGRDNMEKASRTLQRISKAISSVILFRDRDSCADGVDDSSVPKIVSLAIEGLTMHFNAAPTVFGSESILRAKWMPSNIALKDELSKSDAPDLFDTLMQQRQVIQKGTVIELEPSTVDLGKQVEKLSV